MFIKWIKNDSILEIWLIFKIISLSKHTINMLIQKHNFKSFEICECTSKSFERFETSDNCVFVDCNCVCEIDVTKSYENN